MDEEPAARRYDIQSLTVGLSVIEALVRSGAPRGVTDLAQELGMTKGTLFRYLNTLTAGGYVVRDSNTKRYAIGSRLYQLKRQLPDRFPFSSQAHDEMLRLRQETQHTVVLTGHASEDGIATIDIMNGMQEVQFMLRVGSILDLHASAHGKIALAFSPPELLERTLAQRLRRHTAKTLVEKASLIAEVQRVRENGWATAPEESFLGVNAIAAPIFSAGGTFEGGLGLFATLEQIPSEPPPKLIRQVVESAGRLSQRIGFTLERSS